MQLLIVAISFRKGVLAEFWPNNDKQFAPKAAHDNGLTVIEKVGKLSAFLFISCSNNY